MNPITITCNCGAVTVRLTSPPLHQFYCHCDDCQRATGSFYIGVALFPAQTAQVHGATDAWTQRTMPRHRCRACGTQMYGMPDPELIGIRADRLPPGNFHPQFHIHCRHGHMPVRDSLPHYAGLPPEFGGDGERVTW
jgi:hypothetical protein